MSEKKENNEILNTDILLEERNIEQVNTEKINIEKVSQDSSLSYVFLPTIPLRDMTIFPETMIHFDVSRKKSVQAIEEAMIQDSDIFVVAQKDANIINPKTEELYEIGTIAKVKQISKLPNDVMRVLVEGKLRGKCIACNMQSKEYIECTVEQLVSDESQLKSIEKEAMLRYIKELFKQYSVYYPKIGKALLEKLDKLNVLGVLCDIVTINMPIINGSKQKVLEAINIETRYQLVATILLNEIEVARIKNDLATEVKGRVQKNQREYFLREQMQFIKEELGDKGAVSDVDTFKAAVIKLKASESVKEKISKEITRFDRLSDNSSESAVERGYIETLLELPWEEESIDNTDIKRAEQILEEDHYGLHKVKERILEFLAVRTLTKSGDSPIICLVGPPGTGKTSIAKSVARALDKKYVRICLGGIRDEAEIRGHRKTYVGAMPGRIAVGLKQAQVINPLVLLDEIDKVGNDYKGDPSSALLEVLDAEQNCKFRDHYVEIPMDLSKVLFIATANSIQTIPRPLLDRMEIIDIHSYTANEKFHIAREHLYEKQLKQNGLTKKQFSISDEALRDLIQYYTKEGGVRELERKIGELCRKTARKILEGTVKKVLINEKNLVVYLGKHKYTLNKANTVDQIGIVRGLAWTSVGGDTLQIEVNCMAGKGEIELTGQLGDVMKESAMAGITYIRSLDKKKIIPADYFATHDIHIHIPEGAVPKDGPSAGISMALAVYSAVTKIPVRRDVAMTGEITLRGRILPIGGLKEKTIAAQAAGITTIIVPKANKPDIEEIDREIIDKLTIVYADTMQTVMEHALVKK